MRALLLTLLCLTLPTLAQTVPADAWQYRADMTRSAWRVFGPSAPVATLAAQVHQESAWRSDARSWAGAEGLTQFMPGTAADMAKRYPAECAPANPFSPTWAFTCRDRYLRSLIQASKPLGTGPSLAPCSAWAFGLRAYNGGLGWIDRDRRAARAAGADPDDWRAVRPYNAGRRESAHRENREYAERIFRIEPRYAEWGGGLAC